MASENPYASRRLKTSSVSTVVSISLVLVMLGFLGLLVLHARQISDYVKENLEVSVVVKENAREADVLQLQKMIDAADYSKSTVYVSKEEAAKRLMDDLGEDFISVAGYNPLLSSIDIHLHAGFATPDSMAKIVKDLGQNKFVQEVVYQEDLVHLVNKQLGKIAVYVLVFSSLLLIISVALINNTIRLSLYSKRFLIKSMQLVGATRGFIRGPFLAQGFLYGLLGAIIAIVLLSILLYVAQKNIPDLKEAQQPVPVVLLFGAMLVTGVLISTVSTFLAVSKYLKLKLDELY